MEEKPIAIPFTYPCFFKPTSSSLHGTCAVSGMICPTLYTQHSSASASSQRGENVTDSLARLPQCLC
jgi:hypothetical protein